MFKKTLKSMKITHHFYSNTMEPSYDVHVVKQRNGLLFPIRVSHWHNFVYLPLKQRLNGLTHPLHAIQIGQSLWYFPKGLISVDRAKMGPKISSECNYFVTVIIRICFSWRNFLLDFQKGKKSQSLKCWRLIRDGTWKTKNVHGFPQINIF